MVFVLSDCYLTNYLTKIFHSRRDCERLHTEKNNRRGHWPRGAFFYSGITKERLEVHWSASLAKAEQIIENWRHEGLLVHGKIYLQEG